MWDIVCCGAQHFACRALFILYGSRKRKKRCWQSSFRAHFAWQCSNRSAPETDSISVINGAASLGGCPHHFDDSPVSGGAPPWVSMGASASLFISRTSPFRAAFHVCARHRRRFTATPNNARRNLPRQPTSQPGSAISHRFAIIGGDGAATSFRIDHVFNRANISKQHMPR